jgi:hypothetical protein
VKSYVLNSIIPTPKKKMSPSNATEPRHKTCYSNSYFKKTMAKWKLKMEKEGKAKYFSNSKHL